MKKLLITILILLLLIVAIMAGAGVYFYLKLKPFFIDSSATLSQTADQDGATGALAPSGDKNPLLSDQQEKALEQLGIDPAKLPTEITPELEACFTAKLGESRVSAIKGGEQPTTFDFLKAQSCLNN